MCCFVIRYVVIYEAFFCIPHLSGNFVDCTNSVFSLAVMAAVFVSQNNETAVMFVSQTSPVGVELFFLM